MSTIGVLGLLVFAAIAGANEAPLVVEEVPLTAGMERVLRDAHRMELFEVVRDFEANRAITGPKLMSRRATPLSNGHDDDELRTFVYLFIRPTSYVSGGGLCAFSPSLGFRFRDDYHFVDISVCLDCGNVASVIDDDDPLRGDDPEKILRSNIKPRLPQMRRLFEQHSDDVFEWPRE